MGSEGFELCGFDLERDAYRCVVEWLTGDRVAYTDPEGSATIRADWSNGKVAMTGCSYGGTLPFEVATTGVKGLETIIPYAGIASWYDYTNSQGVAKRFDVHYADELASYNGGGLFIDDNWLIINDAYGSWLYTVAKEQEETNGDYAAIWDRMNYEHDYEDINCSALIVHGLNDFNVTTKQSDLMYKAFKLADKNVKLVFHQDGHNDLYGKMFGDDSWENILNKWLCHYLYDTDNGIEDMPELTVQSNIDGSFREYDSWRRENGDFDYLTLYPESEETKSTVSTSGYADYYQNYDDETGSQEDFLLNAPEENKAEYEIKLPEETIISGVPVVSFKASTNKTDFDGLMISAALIDTIDNETVFKAYMTRSEIDDHVPVATVSSCDYGGEYGYADIKEFVPSNVSAKAFSYGWTDLTNPGGGYDSCDYTDTVDIAPGQEYDYSFYMTPTVYEMAPGHKLKLVITTWDPYSGADLDESYGKDDAELTEYYNYDFTINNESLTVDIPVVREDG